MVIEVFSITDQVVVPMETDESVALHAGLDFTSFTKVPPDLEGEIAAILFGEGSERKHHVGHVRSGAALGTDPVSAAVHLDGPAVARTKEYCMRGTLKLWTIVCALVLLPAVAGAQGALDLSDPLGMRGTFESIVSFRDPGYILALRDPDADGVFKRFCHRATASISFSFLRLSTTCCTAPLGTSS